MMILLPAGLSKRHTSWLLLISIACLASCDSNGKSSNDTGLQSLNSLLAQGMDSDPVDGGLDQVQADLLRRFGSADSDPFAVGDQDTVQTLLNRQ